jgi:FkbM family methyltransferase
MKDRIRRAIVNTRLERPVYAAKARLEGASPAQLAGMRDNFDTFEVMRRVLDAESCCADVGASVGSILGRMLVWAPYGTHFAFEPLPNSFRHLEAKFGTRPKVHLVRAAVGDTTGRRSFVEILDAEGYSGFRERPGVRGELGVRMCEVECTRLDEVIRLPLRLIKIDVEGAELGVLRGATAVLERSHPFIVFEHGLGGADVYGTTPQDVFDLLANLGYRTATLRQWLERRPAMTRDSFVDCFYAGTCYYFISYR